MTLSFDERGLLPAVAQDRFTGQVRMLAFMNQAAIDQTLSTGRATFFSRSRNTLWVKGETSRNYLQVHSVIADCDADALLLMVDPLGPTCHTGRPACFFRRVAAGGELVDEPVEAMPFLAELENTIRARQSSTADKSYTRSLLDGGVAKVSEKVVEEASEFVAALQGESDERVLSEGADLLFHMLVALRARGLDLRQVTEKLSARSKISGHAEKAARR